jgi:hypothetical protein
VAVPTFIAASSAGTNAASASVTCNYPAGSASGDLLVMMVGFQRSTTSGSQIITTPTGWTLLDNLSPGVGMVASTYYRFRGAETSVTTTCNNATLEYGTCQIFAYTAATVDPTTPINVSSVSFDNKSLSSASRTMPALTTTQNDTALGFFFYVDHTTSATSITWTGATERVDAYTGSTGRLMYSSATGSQPTAGAITQPTWVPASTCSEAIQFSVAVNPPLNATVVGDDPGSGADTAVTTATTPGSDVGAGAEAATQKVTATTDTGVGAETASVAAQLPGADTGSGAEAATSTASIPGADTGSGTEAAVVAVAVSGADTMQGADTASVRIQAAGDTGSGVDTQVGFAQDSGVSAEAATIRSADNDTATGTDTAFASNTAVTADTGAGVDSAAVIVRPAGDTGSGTDSSVGFASDTGTGTEAATVKTAGADLAAGVDTATSTNAATATPDTGTAVDAANVRFNVGDTGSGADSAALSAQAIAADTGAAVEGATVIVISAGETATGTEQATLRFIVGDTGGAVDNGSIRVTVFGSDTGGGVDSTGIGPTGATDSGQFTEFGTKSVSGFLDNPRVIKVEVEDRVVRIPRDVRTYEVDSEFRTVFIGFEDRRIIRVEDEARTVSIPREV